MSIYTMTKRTQTYVAGDWDGDRDAVEQLKKWNNSDFWSLSFYDVHDKTQSSDSSLNCSIKRSLKTRMDVSKRFVLIVGDKTKSLRSGSCGLCPFHCYNYYLGAYQCGRGHLYYDSRSYVQYECDEAVKAGINIIVLYNSTIVDKELCPECLRYKGYHVAMKKTEYDYAWHYYRTVWDYQSVKKAFANN